MIGAILWAILIIIIAAASCPGFITVLLIYLLALVGAMALYVKLYDYFNKNR